MSKRGFFILALIALLLAACGAPATTEPPPTPPPATQPEATEPPATEAPATEAPRTLTVMTHDSFNASEEVLAQFEGDNNVRLEFLKAGDTGTAVNKAVLSVDEPLADVFYGVDNTFLSRALEGGIFEAYDSPLLEVIPDEYKLDDQNRALPVDYGDVCVNYDRDYLAENGIAPPQNLEDLLKSEYEGLLVVQNPATSSPGLAFLFATIGHFGEDGYLDYWQGLVGNDVLVVNDWETAYNAEFTRAGGTRPLVVSYGSSPPFEVIYAEESLDEPPTGVITGDGACFRQIEFVGILKGSEQRDLAEKWVDFMLSTSFQEDLPLNMFVFPVNPQAELERAFVDYLAVPENPVSLDPAAVDENREAWIEAWTEAVLR